jgi:CheY-like chemotaxis protein
LARTFEKIDSFVRRATKSLLIVEDDDTQRNAMIDLVGGSGDVEIAAAASGEEALDKLKTTHFDCLVLDLKLGDMSGFELLDKIRYDLKLTDLPIIIYTGRDLDKKEETELRKLADTIIVKDVKSMDRLLDETALFLHRIEANLPEEKKQMLEDIRHKDPLLSGRKILVVDDDVRNIFAITSVLECQNMEVLYAENGKDAIDILETTPEIDAVLMDIMMPEMDGYETMRRIKERKEFASIPLIALTAKAMKDDRKKCMDAGASDYISKPVAPDRLISLLRVWLYQ